ncbi:metastasis-associated protein MTA2 isoform X2 [Lates japonicus]|uniref:Metastasis-associated protein MTA2 isoform X2 n=1 Tax=Lates japonicus TaxID=270547 RepID=A0AAD3NFN3_LATJO|nr:metastasis-associated protein MTA2 isoform X2 [Lates japonicus]
MSLPSVIPVFSEKLKASRGPPHPSTGTRLASSRVGQSLLGKEGFDSARGAAASSQWEAIYLRALRKHLTQSEMRWAAKTSSPGLDQAAATPSLPGHATAPLQHQ